MGSLACRAGENKKLLQNATYGLAALKALLDALEVKIDALGSNGIPDLEIKLDDVKGSGFATGTDSLKALRDAIDVIDSIVDSILVDSGTTLEAKLDDIKGSGFNASTDSLKILSDMLDTIQTELTFQHQPTAILAQANPQQNTWYTVLDTTLNVRVYKLSVEVLTTGETLEAKVTIDGNVLTASVAATAASKYIWFWTDWPTLAADVATLGGNTTAAALYMEGGVVFEGRSVKIEVRKTTANGSGTLGARVTYAKR